jgi:Fic-DOC domain mobile mystery protein B
MAQWDPIPGETPIDPSGLKRKYRKTVTARRQLDLVEAENIRKATLKYLAAKPSRRTAPFDYAWSLRLHRQMFGDVWEWAGKLRTADVNIGIHWLQVEGALFNLFGDLAYWEKEGMDLLEQAARLHHRAVQIHPFPGGNGRWARMLANVWLRLHDHPVTEWPEQTIGTTASIIRQQYIEIAIKAADQGDLEPLIAMHRQFTKTK